MYPVLFSIGDIQFPSWHVFYALGAIAAYLLFSHVNSREKICPAKDCSNIFLVCYVAGYFGARAFAIFVEEKLSFSSAIPALMKFGPMTFYGGAIGAFFAGIAYCSIHRLKTLKLADIAIPSALLALAFGRVGCFLNGDDFGKAVSSNFPPALAVVFPNLNDQISRYPVQLYETGAVLVVVILSLLLRPRLKAAGITAALTVIAYGNIRFYLEFLRDDFRGSLFTTYWSPAQEISIFLILIATTAAITITRRLPDHNNS